MTEEECPCCFAPPIDDRAVIVSFLAGMVASQCGVAIRDALCAKHAGLAADACAFVKAREAS